MKTISRPAAPLLLVFGLLFCDVARAQYLNQIGVTLLRAMTTNVDGTGVCVAQVEPDVSIDPIAFEVTPVGVDRSVGLFTYFSGDGSTNVYPNNLGTNSLKAEAVGNAFYGIPNGVATNIAQVDNYDAVYFYTNFITASVQASINCPVVNQSFILAETDGSQATVSDQQSADSQYDNYTAQNATLFVSAVNNGGSVSPPGTSYNGLGVGAYGGASSVGPTIDNGRCKPDITAPATETTYSTPEVSGAAALLRQAALRGDGGSDTNSAADGRTIKVLLLNGAIKPDDWTNIAPSPLDFRYGAGVLNVFNSYKQLTGNKQGCSASSTVASGGAHPPTGGTGSVSVLSGWDFNTNTSSVLNDAVNHYYFNVTNSSGSGAFTATATLVWNRQLNQTNINHLNLFLYSVANSNLVACSTSLVDNVEHLWLPKLPQGRYDLQVWKAAGTPGLTIVSSSETYALAWEFFSQPLTIVPSDENAALTWPVYPAGFALESKTNLTTQSAWSTNNLPAPVVTNNQNYLLLNATNANQFFRLRRP
jgi:hypothetical protein